MEQACGGSTTFPNQDKTENIIMNLVMPLCLRVGSGKKGDDALSRGELELVTKRVPRVADTFGLRQVDITFALTLILHAICPPNTKSMPSTSQNIKTTTEMRTGSLTFTGTRDTKTSARINTSLYQVAFLGEWGCWGLHFGGLHKWWKQSKNISFVLIKHKDFCEFLFRKRLLLVSPSCTRTPLYH